MRAPDYDVTVIGTGPAGCAAAINARRQRLSVLVISAQSPDEPIEQMLPSESLHPGVESLLRHLGAVEALHKATRGTYRGTETAAGLSAFSEGEKGTHIDKNLFNHGLLNLAMSLHADALLNEQVTGLLRQSEAVVGVETGSGKAIISKYVIDASGRSQVAAKILGIENLFFSPPLLCWSGLVTDLPSNHGLFWHPYTKFLETPEGWIWLAPEPTNGSCTYTCLSAKGRQEFALPEPLRDAGIHHPPLKSNMRWRLCATVALEGLIICGDAAALIDPAAGQGNLNALYSGIKASEAAIGAVGQPEKEQALLGAYSTWLREEYLKKVQLLRSYYPPSFVNTWPRPLTGQ